MLNFKCGFNRSTCFVVHPSGRFNHDYLLDKESTLSAVFKSTLQLKMNFFCFLSEINLTDVLAVSAVKLKIENVTLITPAGI